MATILLVDDDTAVRSLLKTVLKSTGFCVIDQPSGQDALAYLDSHNCEPNLMLTDVEMPGIRGPALAKLFLEKCPSAKVILMSGKGEPEDVEVDRSWPFLRKPFSIDQIWKLVSSVLTSIAVAVKALECF